MRSSLRHQIINRYIHSYKVFLVFWIGFFTPFTITNAETISVTLLELQTALNNQGSDPVAQDVFARVNEAIDTSELGLVDGELIFSSTDENVTVEGGCNRTVILQMNTDITLNANTSLSFTLDSLYDPVVISLDVSADIKSIGDARQIVGIRLGQCQNLARDSFSFEATGPAQFSLDATLTLNPVWTAESTLSLFPKIALSGELTQFSVGLDVDDTVLESLIESYIKDRINETFSNSALIQELSSLERDVNDTLASSFDNGRIDIELPEANDEQIIALYQFLQPDARFPITLDIIRNNRQLILSSMLFGEPDSVNGILSDALLCQSASAFFTSAYPISLYRQFGDQCTAVTAEGAVTGRYWSDASCTNEIEYRPTSMDEYCHVALDSERFGNAALLSSGASPWTHSPGTRFDIGALTLDGLTQPLMRRYNYKTVQTGSGVCELEMRVYMGAMNGAPRKPLLALHGGSWQHRASGFLGIEATATHFTNNGFIVFAPFYRLIGESDGNIACNDATLADILSDVNDAMDWIQSRSVEFGMGSDVTVFGQSAGGHLALSLAVNRPDDVRRAVLLYAPSDFEDFAQQIRSGAYTNEAGFKILETVTGKSIDDLDIQSDLVVENSFPARIASSPDTYPPMYILHGEMDSLLPFRQSVRLCNALSGNVNVESGPASLMPNLTSLSSSTVCNANGSRLDLIAEGEHALDLCIAPGLCLSGSEQSAERVAQSMNDMLAWSSAESVDLAVSSGASGIGRVHWNFLWVLFGMFCMRRCNH